MSTQILLFLRPLAQVLPSWNTSITSRTSSSLTVRWSTFPLSVPILRFWVKYTEQNSNVSMVYQVASWYNTHYSGSVLKGYQFYEVKIIAVATSSGNGTYSSTATLIRTKEGGKFRRNLKPLRFLLNIILPDFFINRAHPKK